MPGPHDSPSSSALGFPCLPVAPGLRATFTEHLLCARGSPAPSRPHPGGPSPGDGWSLGMWVGPPGAACPSLAAAGQRPQCGAAGSFHGPRPMTGRLRMPPIIRLTEHKGATRRLGRPGARDGCMGAPGPHPSLPRPLHRGQACAWSWERASLTRRNENHFLQLHGETKTESNGQGLVLTGKGRPPLLSPSPSHSQGGIQWRQGATLQNSKGG